MGLCHYHTAGTLTHSGPSGICALHTLAQFSSSVSVPTLLLAVLPLLGHGLDTVTLPSFPVGHMSLFSFHLLLLVLSWSFLGIGQQRRQPIVTSVL